MQCWLPPFQNWHYFFYINCPQQEASSPQKPSLSANTWLRNWTPVLLLPVAQFFSRYVYTKILGQLWPHIPKDAIPQTPQCWTVAWLKSLKSETCGKSQPWWITIQNTVSPNGDFREGRSKSRRMESGTGVEGSAMHHCESKGASTKSFPDISGPCFH